MREERKNREFLRRRRRVLSVWYYAGPVSVIGLGSLLGWIYFSSSLLVNPAQVVSEIESGTLSESAVDMMATLLPVLVLMLFVTLFVCFAFAFLAFANEKKYIQIIESLLERGERPRESPITESPL